MNAKEASAHAYTVEARIVHPGVSEATANKSLIRFDSSGGQGDVLPGPADLLAAAFAACILKNVERFSRILPFRYEHASVTVTAERQEAPPIMTRVRYVLTLDTDENEHRVDLLHRNIKLHGTIYNTLAAVCDVDGEIRVAART
ncbi:MAG: OsmC family protein [Actinomycetota bacterium]